MNEGKSVRLSKKGQLVLPSKIRKALGVKEGDELLVTLDGKRVILTPAEHHAKRTRGLLKGTWGKTGEEVGSYIERERESWR